MTQLRERRRQELIKLSQSAGGAGKLSAIYLNALRDRLPRAGLTRDELIEEILRLEFDELEKP